MAWTKKQTVIVIGAGVLLVAGTTTMTVKEIQNHRNDNHRWQVENPTPYMLEKNPPVLILRPTQFPDGGGSMGWGKHGQIKQMAKNATIQSLLASAYSFDQTRIIFPDNLPQGNFDLMITIATNDPGRLLQEEITRQFGLVAHREIRETDVLNLKLYRASASGIQISNGGRLVTSGSLSDNTFSMTMSNQTSSGFASQLEQYIGKPVTNRTDLNGSYVFHLQWKSALLSNSWNQASLEQALRDQLGLEVVPSREPIEMLVVEKAQ